MFDDRELAAFIALLRRGDQPWSVYAELVEEAGSAVAVLESAAPLDGGQEALFASPTDSQSTEEVEDEIRAWRASGVKIVHILDDDYPVNLRSIFNRPPLLFYKGTIEEADCTAVAVVGSRAASAPGIRAASDLSSALVSAEYTVFSGLAKGIDAAAHKAALNSGGRTVAVIGTGIFRSYPAENADLQEAIAQTGAVISQFWPDAPPTKKTFPMRNAVMSGLTLATVVVEAGERSGARMQARLALEHGRPVFLFDSLLEHEWARSCAGRPGATVVSSVDDVIAGVTRIAQLAHAPLVA